jgi:hypothetical protein
MWQEIKISPEIPFQNMTLNQLFKLEDRFSATLGGTSDVLTRRVHKKLKFHPLPIYSSAAKRKVGKSHLKKMKRKKIKISA